MKLRISIKHTEFGFVDIDADKDSPIEDLVRAAFDSGDAVIVTSTLDIVDDRTRPKSTWSKVPRVVK